MDKTIQLLELLREIKDNPHSFVNMAECIERALGMVDAAYDELSDTAIELEQANMLLAAYERGGAA